MQSIIELDGRLESDRRKPVFDALRTGTIVAYRNLPEIQRLGTLLGTEAAKFCGQTAAQNVADFFNVGELHDLEAFSAIYRAFRPLRDSRYLSCLFSDLIDGMDLPRPILIDSGYCRMIAPGLAGEAIRHPDLFCTDEFGTQDPNEAEHMVHGGGRGGSPHRDLDVRHYHFQMNLWFPLHDLDEKRTLLIFPNSYHRDVPQYGKISDLGKPSDWGFGKALQIPLKFGDVIAFHSQVLHASPTQAPDRNRFTIEIRVGAGCEDDNTRIYRRLFWGLRNFLADDPKIDAVARAEQLVERSPRLEVDRVVAASTAHAVINLLFRTADASLKAGYVRRPDAILDNAYFLDAADWSRILKRLDELPCDEDLLLLAARLLLRQGYQVEGTSLLRRICNRTTSYFWALEVGYFAVAHQELQLAETAFEKARRLAAESDVTLDRYTPSMPPPRSPGLLQLLPDAATKISEAFLRRLAATEFRDPTKFDHRLYWTNPALASPPHQKRRDLRQAISQTLGAFAHTARDWQNKPEKQ